MSTDVTSSGETVSNAVKSTLRDGWRMLMIVGAAIVVLGIPAILFPYFTGVSLTILLGILLLAAAITHLANVFRIDFWEGRIWQAALAVVYGIAGLLLVLNPVLGLTTLTLLLIAFLFVDGLTEIGMGIRLRGENGWGWLVGSGVLSLVLAGLLWIGWPAAAEWAIGLLFGVNLLSTGTAMIVVAWRGQQAEKATALGEKGMPGGT